MHSFRKKLLSSLWDIQRRPTDGPQTNKGDYIGPSDKPGSKMINGTWQTQRPIDQLDANGWKWSTMYQQSKVLNHSCHLQKLKKKWNEPALEDWIESYKYKCKTFNNIS